MFRLTKCQSRFLLSFFNVGSRKNGANIFLNKRSVKMHLLVSHSFPPTQTDVLHLIRKLELRCFGKWQLKEARSQNGSAESYNSFWQVLFWEGALVHPAMQTYSNLYSVTNQCGFYTVFFNWQCPLCPNLGYSLCPSRYWPSAISLPSPRRLFFIATGSFLALSQLLELN